LKYHQLGDKLSPTKNQLLTKCNQLSGRSDGDMIIYSNRITDHERHKEVMVSSNPSIYSMQHIYSIAKSVLNDSSPVSKDELKKYFDIKRIYRTKNDILRGLLGSLQNRQMQANVIGLSSPHRVGIYKEIFFDYDSNLILKTYKTDAALFERFDSVFTIGNRDSKNNSFRKYAKSVRSACLFMERFESADDFTEFAERFSYNELSSAALPLVIEKEIYGLGFPLACDWLKELGFSEYPKPDVHINEIFYAIGLSEKNDYSSYKAVIEMAKATGDTAFNVDRTFWLIASGRYFYHDKKVPSRKDEFINTINSQD